MSLIAEESINSIREKANLVEIVSNYVTLKKAGRSYKAVCPFHREKTPSFVVDAQKQLFHCFGCSEGGNIFTFIMKIENLDFVEAVEFLAKKTGQTVKYVSTGKNKRLQSERERFYQINKEAAGFYHYLLMQSDDGKIARDYLKNRSYGKNVATAFKIGYASNNKRSLINFLVKKGYKPEEIQSLDLAYNPGGQPRDRFFNRLMFPIEDARGNIVGFGGRVLREKDVPKYLNSAQTPIFHKGKQFYGLNLAKNEIVRQDQVILVEGYTDVISLYRAGFKNVVATLGTALTVEHLEILGRFCSTAIMLFDSDAAGLKAASRAVEFSTATNLELLVAVLPEGDPADFVSARGGQALKPVLAQAVPVVDFCLQQMIKNTDIGTPKKRISLVTEAFGIISRQQNAILEKEYLQKLAQLSNIEVENLVVEYAKKYKKQPLTVSQPSPIDPEETAEQMLMVILIEKPELVEKCLSIINKDDLRNETYKEILELMITNRNRDVAHLINQTDDVKLKKCLSSLSFISKPGNSERALSEICKKIKDFTLKRQIKNMKVVLEKTNPMDNRAEYDKLFKQLIELEAKRRDLAQVS